MVKVRNNSSLSADRFHELAARLGLIRGLNLALEWALSEPDAKNIPDVVTQDEFTHDVIFGFEDRYVVFDTT
ncbi:MAG: hypothetical protein OEM82_02080 [Acidobacteriota bacterium]|nr:hypothetical protein [Acidobacteriota bacterium]MDH3529210.1 hypothetical protein [Acidobacteriota bacterium]